MLFWLLALLATLVGLFFVVSGQDNPLAGIDGTDLVYLIVGGGFALLCLLSISGDYRGRLGTALRHAATWVLLALALITGYAYRDDLSSIAYRVAGEILPPGKILTVEDAKPGERSVRLRRHGSGHFLASGTVNGSTVRMLIDTGASTVVLKPADAARAGIDTANLAYTVAVSTANGVTYAAPVRLRSVALGPIELRDVEALVSRPGSLNESLLGMSFLRRLRSYEFTGEYLTLRG